MNEEIKVKFDHKALHEIYERCTHRINIELGCFILNENPNEWGNVEIQLENGSTLFVKKENLETSESKLRLCTQDFRGY